MRWIGDSGQGGEGDGGREELWIDRYGCIPFFLDLWCERYGYALILTLWRAVQPIMYLRMPTLLAF
jgi:hypothetical protein